MLHTSINVNFLFPKFVVYEEKFYLHLTGKSYNLLPNLISFLLPRYCLMFPIQTCPAIGFRYSPFYMVLRRVSHIIFYWNTSGGRHPYRCIIIFTWSSSILLLEKDVISYSAELQLSLVLIMIFGKDVEDSKHYYLSLTFIQYHLHFIIPHKKKVSII